MEGVPKLLHFDCSACQPSSFFPESINFALQCRLHTHNEVENSDKRWSRPSPITHHVWRETETVLLHNTDKALISMRARSHNWWFSKPVFFSWLNTCLWNRILYNWFVLYMVYFAKSPRLISGPFSFSVFYDIQSPWNKRLFEHLNTKNKQTRYKFFLSWTDVSWPMESLKTSQAGKFCFDPRMSMVSLEIW